MKKRLFLLYLIVLIYYPTIFRGQNYKNTHAVSGSVLIKGRILNGNDLQDTLRFEFFKVTSNGRRFGAERDSIIPDSNGVFEFRTTPIEHMARICLFVYGHDNKYLNSIADILINYIVEPGDSIQMDIKKTANGLTYYFSGRGATKFTCRREVDSLSVAIDQKDDPVLKQKGFYGLNSWEIRKKYEDSVIKLKMEIVNRYKDYIGSDIMNLMYADIIGEQYYPSLGLFFAYDSIEADKENYLKQYSHVFSIPIDTLKGDIIAYSPNYILFLEYYVLAKQFYEHNLESKYDLDNVFNQTISQSYSRLKLHFTGYLREVICLNFLTDVMIGSRNGEVDSCLEDLLTITKTRDVREIIENWTATHAKNKEAFNFSLPDPSRKFIHLSDLKNKVILVEIWFTGCQGCLQVSREMQQHVYPVFENNPNIVFVSVSGDRDRKTWLTSVKEEKYTRKENINLYTNGLGFDHPFMKYYSFYGGPFLMIIGKDGKIFASSPPIHGHTSDLVDYLREALRQE